MTRRTVSLDVERVRDGIARIPVPLTFFSVPVNVYVVRAERVVLIDTGPRTPEAREKLHAGVASLDMDLRDVGDVIVTHHHVDHGGLLEETLVHGARAWAHEEDAPRVEDVPNGIEGRLGGFASVAKQWGLSDELRQQVVDYIRSFSSLGGVARAVERIRGGGSRLPIPGASLRAIHVPGHSEGQIVLHDERENVLYSADHVLERVSPNIDVYVPPYRGRTSGLHDFLESLELLKTLPRDILVCPGHGRPFTGLHARIDAIQEHHAERLAAVLVLLERQEPRTILDLSHDLWPTLDHQQVSLACREVHGHLDVLLERAQVSREDRDGVWYWRRAA